eukprot:115561_1
MAIHDLFKIKRGRSTSCCLYVSLIIVLQLMLAVMMVHVSHLDKEETFGGNMVIQSTQVFATDDRTTSLDYNTECDLHEWSCTIIVSRFRRTKIQTCWNTLSPVFREGRRFIGFPPFWDHSMRQFVVDCQARLQHITLHQYNGHKASHTVLSILNTTTLQVFVNNKPLQFYQEGRNLMYSAPIPLSGVEHTDDRIRYIYNITNDAAKHELRFNFVPLDDAFNILSSAVWQLPTWHHGGMKRTECKQLEEYSRKSGWKPCVENIDFNDCIVYSIGVSQKNQFDVKMGELGCKVYSFDCTVNYDHHMAENVEFYPWCIGAHFGDKYKLDFETVENSKIMSIIEIMDSLGHSEKAIDVLKVDCEGCEWSLMNDLVKYENAKYLKQKRFKQLLIEFHVTSYLIAQSHMTLSEIHGLFEHYKHYQIYEENVNPGSSAAQHVANDTVNEGWLNACCCYEYHMTL